jgi:carbohydrate kinase (thermoresistant glucokinase family)
MEPTRHHPVDPPPAGKEDPPEDAAPTPPRVVLVMGVSGSGKSEVGRRLAAALAARFIEADELHPPENIAKMSRGVPLTDDDRRGWLVTIRARIDQALAGGERVVVACSALKRAYRRVLLDGHGASRLVHLAGSSELIGGRLEARRGHFMPTSLLRSQFDALEPPGPDEQPLVADVRRPPEELAAALAAELLAWGRQSWCQGL